MAAITEYSPFEQQLLNHLSQLSTNVNTLLQVFVNLQSQLIANANTNAATVAVNETPHITTLQPPDTNTINTEATDNQQTISGNSNKSHALPESAAIDNIPHIHPDEEEKEEKVALTALSLDSSDEDENSEEQATIATKPKSKAYTACKHRSKYNHGLNRSKSTTSSSCASMNALLRANHIRHHKYNGILHKSKRKAYDQISDSVLNRSLTKNRKNKTQKHAPKFDPEHVFLSKNNRIIINVGGSLFATTLNTVSADQSSMLSAMFSGRFKIERDENGSIFIDRDPTHFRHILNFLRDGIEYLKHGGLLQQPDAIVNELLQEAKYYNIRPLVDYIQLQQTRKSKKKGDELTHEKQYKLVTNIAIDEFEDVFNKYTGSAGYDFEEWIFVSPYKTSRNSVSAPTFMMLFSKKLSRAEVRLLDRLTNIDFQ